MATFNLAFDLAVLLLVLATCSSSSRLLSRNSFGAEDDSRNLQAETRSSECEDKLPTCAEFGGVSQEQFCCMIISVANETCAKSCMFCTETSVIPGSPIQGVALPGGGGSSGAPSVVTQQNPCKAPDSSKPPTVGVNPGR